MFSGFMVNSWAVGTMVAAVAGVVGIFVVLRRDAFAAHAIPNGAFAGAAAANLLGVDPVAMLAVFAMLAAWGIGALGRRGRHDVAIALALVMMFALGALFLSRSTQYEAEVYSLLFGEILGVSSAAVLPVALMGLACLAVVAALYRPLLLSSVVPDVAESRGVRPHRMETGLLVVIALATAVAVPVVGALLVFSLMIGPPAAARSVTSRPWSALAVSVALTVATLWIALAAAYVSNWPVGFYVGIVGAGWYGAGRAWAALRRARTARPDGACVGGGAPLTALPAAGGG